MSKQPEAYTIWFFPWLAMRKAISVNGVRFVPFRVGARRARSEFRGHEDSIRQILAAYVHAGGQPVSNCTVACVGHRVPVWNLTEEDWDSLRRATAYLALASFASNRYFSQLGPYVNSSFLECYGQKFTEPATSIALRIPRRDGGTLVGGYKYEATAFTKPPQCEWPSPVSVDSPLLRALDRATARDAKLIRWLKPALSFFLLANTDSAVMEPEAELILTASAFEQVLGVKGQRKALDLSRKLGELLKTHGTRTVADLVKARPGVRVDKDHTDKQMQWFPHRKWAEELYLIRDFYVHGNPLDKRSWGWPFDTSRRVGTTQGSRALPVRKIPNPPMLSRPTPGGRIEAPRYGLVPY